MRLPSAASAGDAGPAREDRIVVHHDDPSVRGERLVDRGREVGEANEMRRAVQVHVEVRSRTSVGSARNCTSTRAARWRTADAGRDDLREHGIGKRGARAARRDRLDDRVAEALPRRREHDEVARRVRVGGRRRAPDRDRHRRALDDALERRARSRLRPGREIQKRTVESEQAGEGAVRTAARRARSCARSRATAAASRSRRRRSRTWVRVAARSPGGGSRSK